MCWRGDFLGVQCHHQNPLPIASECANNGIDAANNDSKPAASSTLFVVGLNKRTTSDALHNAFSKFGQVKQARVVMDRASGCSKGYGFVTYSTLEEAAKGIEGMNAKYLEGWIIFVEYARPKTPPAQPACQMMK